MFNWNRFLKVIFLDNRCLNAIFWIWIDFWKLFEFHELILWHYFLKIDRFLEAIFWKLIDFLKLFVKSNFCIDEDTDAHHAIQNRVENSRKIPPKIISALMGMHSRRQREQTHMPLNRALQLPGPLGTRGLCAAVGAVAMAAAVATAGGERPEGMQALDRGSRDRSHECAWPASGKSSFLYVSCFLCVSCVYVLKWIWMICEWFVHA